MTNLRHPVEFFAPAVLAAGLVLAVAVFVLEIRSFRSAVLAGAEHDLAKRTELASENLREPLRTQDFRYVRTFGEACRREGVRLTVLSGEHGVVFDSQRDGADGEEAVFVVRPCGEYRVRLGIPAARLLAPFTRARRSFALAGLVGATGVLLVFFAFYRQRVRIRELAALENFRRTFIADVTHEIRTPLAGMLGAADLMDAASPLVGLIKREGRRLNALVQSILDLARLERDGLALTRAEVDVAALVRETVSVLEPQAAAARVVLTVDAPSSCPFRCDARLVETALANLIGNALRHSQAREVAVSCRGARHEVRLVVEDHGVGIPPEHAQRVFDRFYRVDSARAAATGGAGLGLAIVRQIARLHGGDVLLEPAHPSGCRFTIVLRSSSKA